jgi:uncharacterized membrane protein YhhN
MKKSPLIVFCVLALLHLLGVFLVNETLMFSTKPLLMPSLAVWLIFGTSGGDKYSYLRRMVLGALLFSTLGDMLLMFSGGIFFLLGLGAFLLAHVCYVAAFLSISSVQNGFLRQNLWWVIPFLVFPILLLSFLWEGIPIAMRLPVSVYAGVISLMALSVVNLKGNLATATFWTLLAGAVWFLISDSLIAIGKFGQAFEGVRLAVMGTYILGQYLLVRGVRGQITGRV